MAATKISTPAITAKRIATVARPRFQPRLAKRVVPGSIAKDKNKATKSRINKDESRS